MSASATPWRPIDGHPRHLISSSGEVRRQDGTVLVGHIDADGYRRVRIDGKQHRVHRLVCTAFHGPAPEGHEACHNDGDRLNNNASNLRWGTRAENVADAQRHGTFSSGRPPQASMARGESNGSAKLTAEIVREARRRHAEGVSGRQLAREYGVTSGNMSLALRGKSWAHVGPEGPASDVAALPGAIPCAGYSAAIRELADVMDRENPKRNHYREVAPHSRTMRAWADELDRAGNTITELLEALDAVLPCVGSPIILRDTPERVRAACSAIAKARGEA